MLYDEVVQGALGTLIKEMEAGKVRLDTEADLRAMLFRGCFDILLERGHSLPVPVHAETKIERGKADLTVGPQAETVLELKYEPFASDEGTLFLREKDGPHSIEHDIKKLKACARRGRSGHLIVIEGEGRTKRGEYYFPKRTPAIGIPSQSWQEASGFVWVHYTVSPQL